VNAFFKEREIRKRMEGQGMLLDACNSKVVWLRASGEHELAVFKDLAAARL
jgi:hypothetical protein